MTDVAMAAFREPSVQKRRKLDVFWLAAPGMLFLVALFLIPTLQMLSASLFDKSGALSASAFEKLFTTTVYFRVMATTFTVAVEVTVLCLLVGYPLAYWLAGRTPRVQRIALLFVLIPFWTSPLVLNFSWLVLLGRSGLVAKIAAAFGWSDVDFLFNRPMVIFAMVHTMLPLTIVTLLPIMNKVDQRLTMAARTLGASAAEAFWQVYLPLSMRGVATAGLLTFISALGFFITPALVGGRQDTMITQLIIQQINRAQNWQLGSALAVVLVAGTRAPVGLLRLRHRNPPVSDRRCHSDVFHSQQLPELSAAGLEPALVLGLRGLDALGVRDRPLARDRRQHRGVDAGHLGLRRLRDRALDEPLRRPRLPVVRHADGRSADRHRHRALLSLRETATRGD